MTTREKGITCKMFAGFLINSELRMHLKASEKWKEHEILQESIPDQLKVVPFEKRDYFGLYIEPAQIPVNEIEPLEANIKQSLEKLFPKCNLESFSLYLFTQPFVQ